MKVKIYENYGVLAHEKQSVYTTAPEATATLSEPLYVNIPDDMHPYTTIDEQIALDVPDGFNPYLLWDVLGADRDGAPAIRYVDRYGERRTIRLDTCEA